MNRGKPGDGQNDVTSLTRSLRALSKDPSNADAYSLIPVHAWLTLSFTTSLGLLVFRSPICRNMPGRSHNVSDVHLAAQLLGEAFIVVTPDEFVARLKRYVKKNCDQTKAASGNFLESCYGGHDNCGVLTNWTCSGRGSAPIFNDFFDHTSCSNNTVSNCFGRMMCQGYNCTCVENAVGSFLSSCSNCENSCGVLSECRCEGTVATQRTFEYTACPGIAVANCFGALICQGEPCE
jgi:hypothetical protein